MSLLVLTAQDFSTRQGSLSPLLCTDIQQLSLVLFYSTQCSFCHQLLPIFKQLPEIVKGCQFAIINISNHMDVVRMSGTTNTPIKYVPMIVMYVNGIPYMEYKDRADLNQIRKFIIDQYNVIQRQLGTASGNYQQQAYHHYANNPNNPNVHWNPELPRHIPQYSLGNPLHGDDLRCYLSVQELDPRKR